MGKPTSGGAGGSGGRQRAAAEYTILSAPDWDVDFDINENYGQLNEPYKNFATPRYANQLDEHGIARMRDVEIYEMDGMNVNYRLRNGELPKGKEDRREKIDRVIASLDAIARPIDTNLVVYRGSSVRGIREQFDKGTLNGTIINDKGFISTSTNKSIATIFQRSSQKKGKVDAAAFNIRIPKGTSVVYANPNGSYQQNEIIINRGSSLRITGSRIENGVFVIDAEVV